MVLLLWNVYELSSDSQKLQGVSCRRRIRDFALVQGMSLFVDNAADKDNVVRIAVLEGEDIDALSRFIYSAFTDVHLELVAHNIANPVLSNITVNYPKNR